MTTTKTIGIILEVLVLPIIIVNILLMKMPNTDRATSTLLLAGSMILLVTGGLLCYGSQDSKEPKENKEKGEKQ